MAANGANYDSEEALLGRVKDGDSEAMKTLYSRNVRYLTAVCSRYIIDDEDIRDVLQEAFIKIFSSIGSFEYRGVGSLRGWMTKILLNETMKWVKCNERFSVVSLSLEEVDIADEEPDIDAIPLDAIHDMIRSLPSGYRTIFNLYVFEGKTHKEIAEILGIKENTSASQLLRAKAALAEKIRRYHASPNPVMK